MVERFWSEDYTVGYYTEVVDNEKTLEDVPNPKKNLTIDELVDLLNQLYDGHRRFEFVLQEAIRTERTELGRNVLKQLADNLGVKYE